MNKIHIVNLLLTRKCNLKCSYCGIARQKGDCPSEYKEYGHFLKNEMDTQKVLVTLNQLKIHNPDVFIIIYGGEPVLRKDLNIIVNYCNEFDINYTVISNNSTEIRPKLNSFLDNVGYVKGYTASVDPLIFSDEIDSDRLHKSKEGFRNLVELSDHPKVDDLVAEITVDKTNFKYLERLVRDLSKHNISSDITFIDIAKNPYYDFSNVTDTEMLVPYDENIMGTFIRMIADDECDIHMKESLLPEIAKILPSELDCKMEEDVNTIAIDADGSMRLCLRIRGTVAPEFDVNDIFTNSLCETLKPEFVEALKEDKITYCEGCNHTCYIMGNLISKGALTDDLIHSDRRR